MTPEEAEAGDRGEDFRLRKTIRSAKKVAVWIALITFGLLMLALLFAFCALTWTHIGNVIGDPGKVSELLGNAVEWILIAMAALFLDRRLRD